MMASYNEVSREMAQELLQKLRVVHSRWEASSVVIADYQVALGRCVELEQRVGQLQKENAELLDECQMKEITIENLGLELTNAQESLRKEVEDLKCEKKGLEKDKEELTESLDNVTKECHSAQGRVEELEQETALLKEEIAEANTATSLAVTEMQTSKAEAEETWGEMRKLETENSHLIAKISADQESLHKKWEDVMEMEAMVQRRNAEVENLRAQIEFERDSQQGGTIASFWKRRQNPFAKRLMAYAKLLEKGDRKEAIQGLDVLLMELKEQKGKNKSKPRVLQGSTEEESGFFVLDDEPDEPLPDWKNTQIELPGESQLLPKMHQGGCTCISVSMTGTLVATGGADGQVMLWDPCTKSVQMALEGLGEGVRDVAFTCSGATVLAAMADKSVRMWNTASGSAIHTLTGHSRSVNCVACDPGDVTKAISAGEDRYIRFWDLSRGYRIQNHDIRLGEMTNAACFASVSNIVAYGLSRGTLKLWDIRTSTEVLEHPRLHNDGIVAVYSMPMSTHLLLTAGKDNILTLFDYRSNMAVQSFRDKRFSIGFNSYMGKGKCCLGISQNEQFVTAGSNSGSVAVWNKDETNVACLTQLKAPVHNDPVTCVGWAKDRLFSCDKSGKIVAWDPSL